MNILYVIRDMSFIEPLGIMFLSAIAKQDGHSSSLAIINEEDVLDKIKHKQPDIVCLSVMSVDAKVFIKLAKEIKHLYPGIIIVVGGPHATFETETVRSWPVE
jgi:radical SAM superfamily enzyme YgiQ (UPF0313 family)